MISPEKAEHYLQSLPAGCLVFTRESTITFVNGTLCEMLGYDSADLVSGSIEKILSISSRIFYQTHFFPLLQLKQEVSEIFLTLKSRNTGPIPVMVNAKLVMEGGQPSYLCVIASVFERQKYEAQLIDSQKALRKAVDENEVLNRLKNDLESNQFELDGKVRIYEQVLEDSIQMGKALTHDMQEPIRKITFFSDALRYQIPLNETVERLLAGVSKSVKRLGSLARSLLDYTDISSLKEPVVSLSLQDLINHAKNHVSKELDVYDFEIVIASEFTLEGRERALRRAFIELIKNAVENRDPGHPLVISIGAIVIQHNAYQANSNKYRYTDHLQITITDNGKGFPEQYASYIFGLLAKLDPSTDGVGLGLALCRQIISHHFGVISALSSPGKGATVTIRIPKSQPKKQVL